MDLIDHISQIAARIPKQIAHIDTEEATKTAFVMRFISALRIRRFQSARSGA